MSLGTGDQPQQEKKLANVSKWNVSANQQALPVPYFAGVAKLSLTWVAPGYNLKTKQVSSGGGKGGKGGGSSSGQKKFYRDMIGIAAYCPDDAPTDALLYLLVNDEIAFTGPLSRSPGTHYAAFTVQKYCQAARVYWGTKDVALGDTMFLQTRQVAIPGGVNPRDTSTWPRLDAAGDPVAPGTPIPGVSNPLSGHYDQHNAMRNILRFEFRQLYLGDSDNAPNVVAVVARGCKFFDGARFEADEAGVNPIAPIYELVTDDLLGVGFPESRLVKSIFQATADAMTAAGILVAPVLRSRVKVREFLADYVRYYDGWFRSAGNKLEAGYWDHGNLDFTGLPELAANDLAGEPHVKPGRYADTKNFFTPVFTNREHWYNDDSETARYVDQANVQIVGERRPAEPDQVPFIIDGAQAQRWITESGKMRAALKREGDAPFLWERLRANNLKKPGLRLKLDSPSDGISMIARLIGLDIPADRDGKAKAYLEKEVGTYVALYTPPAAIKPPDFIVRANEIDTFRIFELPSQLKDRNSIEVAILAQRPTPDIYGFRVHLSTDNSVFVPIADQRAFCAYGKIAAEAYAAATPINDTTVGMVVDLLGSDLEQVVTQTTLQRDDNALLAVFGNEIGSIGTVTPLGSGRVRIFQLRARYGSLQSTHAIDTEVFFIYRDRILPISNENFQAGAIVYFKLEPYIPAQSFDISGISSTPHTFGDGPFILSGLELAGQGNDPVFTGRNPKFAWRMFSTAGAEISGPELSLGAWDDQFAQFNLRVRDAVSGAVVWTGSCKVTEYVFDYEQNALCADGPRRTFYFEVAALARDGRQTPWLSFGEPFTNPNETFDQAGRVGGGINSVDFYLTPSTAIDHAGCILFRSLDPAFTVDPALDWSVVGNSHGGVELVFKGPDNFFSVPQPEGSTYYYRVASFDTFWNGDIADLILGAAVAEFTRQVTPTLSPPPIDQGSQSFTGTISVHVASRSGERVVYAFNRNTNETANEWPGAVDAYTALAISTSCILYWRGYDSNGVPTIEGSIALTLVASGSGGAATCPMPSLRVVSGTEGFTAVNVAIDNALGGATNYYSKNGATEVAYTVPVNLALGDYIDFRSTASGYLDSPADHYENTDLTH